MTAAICSRRDLAHVAAFEHLVAVLVDDLALLVHDVVVLEDALADRSSAPRPAAGRLRSAS